MNAKYQVIVSSYEVMGFQVRACIYRPPLACRVVRSKYLLLGGFEIAQHAPIYQDVAFKSANAFACILWKISTTTAPSPGTYFRRHGGVYTGYNPAPSLGAAADAGGVSDTNVDQEEEKKERK
jgi:hypothetical protein